MSLCGHPWDHNEHGMWCPSCGEHIAAPWTLEDGDYDPPVCCRTCGFPDDPEQMAAYHCGDDE